MRTENLFPSRFQTVAAFGKPVVATIAEFKMETMNNTGKEKPVLYFEDDDVKPLVLNKTNTNVLEEALGYETDDWVGHKVKLFKGTIKTNSGNVASVRLEVVSKPITKKAAPKKNDDDGDDDLDDEIPFN